MSDWIERLIILMMLTAGLHTTTVDYHAPRKYDNPSWDMCGAAICLCAGETCSPWVGGD